MTKIKKDYKIDDIINLVKSYNNENLDLINKSYEYTSQMLDKTKLQDALNVSYILTTVQADAETISANILSYLLINDLVKRNILEKDFDFNIVKLSSNINKLKSISLSTENDYLIEYYKKVIVGMTEDVRVIIVALADRVYLMHQLDKNDNSEDNKRIAKETIEIFAPLAHHLGVYKLKSELEDMSLRYLKPDVYYDIVEKLNGTKVERDNIINEMMREVSDLLTLHNIVHEIKGRSKSIYSIYNKLDKGRKFNDIYDLFALRIMVSDEATCYLVLGLIHSKFKPIPKRFKDFIAMPKSNGYRSLHTTVFGVQNTLFEIQIRTFEMNEVAENGLAAHWSYKEHRSADNLSSTDQKLEFFKTVIDHYQENVDNYNFLELQDDKMHGNIYVFTPKGDVIELPYGSTPIDFAYKVHTKVGEEMVGCVVNNKIVPLNYVLEDNDIVKINTSKGSTPKLAWLKIAKLNQTKNKIKSYFNREHKEEIIKFGEVTLNKYLKRKHLSEKEVLSDVNLKKILKELKCKDLNDLFLNIGNSKYSPKSVVDVIYPKDKSVENKQVISKNNNDIEVLGVSDIKVLIAACCNPIPGDDIVGVITKSKGITIHNKNCLNLKNKERLIEVKFKENTKNSYLTKIKVYTIDNHSHLGDLIGKISNSGIVVNNVVTNIVDLKYNYLISFHVKNKTELDYLISNIKKQDYVLNVERIIK